MNHERHWQDLQATDPKEEAARVAWINANFSEDNAKLLIATGKSEETITLAGLRGFGPIPNPIINAPTAANTAPNQQTPFKRA